MTNTRVGMIDITAKNKTQRRAVAEVYIVGQESTLDRIDAGDTPKGEVYPVARAAGIMAAKSTHQVLPHCHPLAVTDARVGFERQAGRLQITVEITALDRTGVEMEALYAASVVALTIYDMLKFTDDELRMDGLRLLEKTGGKRDYRAS